MSGKDQWGAQYNNNGYNNAGPNPGYSQTYAPPPGPPQGYPPPQGEYDQKSPYEGDRFKPKKRINDPIILILFVLTVRPHGTIKFGALSDDANSLLALLLSPP